MSQNSCLFLHPPQWKGKFRGIDSKPPFGLEDWLQERGSLTKRLRQVYGQHLAVKLLFHHWKPAFAEECAQLKAPHHRYHLIREVLLHIGQTPLVLARTILPEPTIRIAHRNLSHLGTRPLGEVIFAYPDLQLRQRHFCICMPESWRSDMRCQYPLEQPIWGRRTQYAIHNQPLLVSEFFLPAILKNQSTQIL